MDRKISLVFSKIMKYREEADNNAHFSFNTEDFRELKIEVEALAQKISIYGAAKGYR